MLSEYLPRPKSFQNPLRWISHSIFAATILVASQASSADQLVGFESSSKNGLQRAWFSQVRVDRTRNRVTNWTLDGDLLLALTSTGTIHAVDTRSGRTQWVVQIGDPNYPSTGPAASANFVSALNGSVLYMLDRSDGHMVWSRRIGNVSEAAPVLSQDYAFVAQINGRVEGFRLDDPTSTIWEYQSIGHIYQSPLLAGEFVTWVSDRGHLYFGDAIHPRVLFRIETNDEIVSPPTSHGEYLYATSLGGYLYCYDNSNGAELWRFSSGMPITKKPVVVDGRVYVSSEAPALYAIDAENGRHLWTAEGVVQFVAQGADRVYGVDRFGTLMILDGESGTLAGRIVTGDGITALANGQSDRIFLVADTGLVQCYHEQGATEPTSYLELPDEQQELEEGDQQATPTAEPAEEPVDDAPVEQPAEEPEQEENPFDDSNPFG